MPEPPEGKTIVIHLHREAPPKPAWGRPCNGCGVCCAYAPCPIGVVVSQRMSGACAALEWDPTEARYRCGMLDHPARYTRLKARWVQALVRRIARRMISAGSGCDCDLEPGPER